MGYFFTQSLASFLLLLSYVFARPMWLTFAVVLKLGLFPFMLWFFHAVLSFPNSLFLLVATLHKLPVLLILLQFRLPLQFTFLWISFLLTLSLSGVMMVQRLDLRILLVASSVGNNAWLLLAQQAGVSYLIAFFCLYVLSLSGVVLSLGASYGSPKQPGILTSVSLLSLSALPPFPLFFIKLGIVWVYFSFVRQLAGFILFLAAARAMVVSYVSFYIVFISMSYSWSN